MFRIACSNIILLLCITVALSQNQSRPLASIGGKNVTAEDLSPDTRKLLESRDSVIANARAQLLQQMIDDALLQEEARTTKTSVEAIVNAARASAPQPNETAIKAVYDANREALGGRSLAESRKQIVEFLLRDTEHSAVAKYAATLSAKYKLVKGKDINSPDLAAADVIFTVAGKTVAASDFDAKYRLTLYDLDADISDEVKTDLDNHLYAAVVETEAKGLELDASELIAREVTNKMRDFSDGERAKLETAFRDRLYAKYNVVILYRGPTPIVQDISVDDDPTRGAATAPVTVVMFSDFQCPACSATHPVLKDVMATYGDRIRFVVRDFPLVDLHANAFRAALAANAANSQGKFFEYVELLYANQGALDDASLSKYAAQLGLNVKRFELDLSLAKTADEVRKDMEDGKRYGVNGTPTIFVNGVKIRRLTAEDFHEAIESALKK